MNASTISNIKNNPYSILDLELKTEKSFIEKIIKPILFLSATFSIIVVFIQSCYF